MIEGTRLEYEILALRFGTHADRSVQDNFLFNGARTRPGGDASIDFYLWAIRGDHGFLLVDTGFSEETARLRARTLFRSPVDALGDLGVSADEVPDVIITHLHYDHAGNLDRFPAARIHMQEEEATRFCTGPAMSSRSVRGLFEVAGVQAAVQGLYEDRLVLHRGAAEPLPGITLHPVPGHTPGTQVVRVPTARGHVVLASDATHLWANIRARNPFPILDSADLVLDGYNTIEALADGEDHIIPGHDPLVAKRFPSLPGKPHWSLLHEAPRRGSPP